MTTQLKINKKSNFVQKFLVPISRVSDMCIITVNSDGIFSINKSSDNSIFLYSKTSDIELSEKTEIRLNVPDIKKLIKALDCINSESIVLTLNSNNIQYTSPSIKFKFHLIDDGIIVPPSISIQKIQDFEFDTMFKISSQTFNSLLKSSTFLSDSNKVYISTEDGHVNAELTDKSKSNIDSYSSVIAATFEGKEIAKAISFSFELFRVCSLLKTSELDVSINNQRSIIAFDINDDNYKLKYISTGLVC